jgi:hypothetical protein
MLLEDKYKQLPLIPHLLKALLPAAGIIYKNASHTMDEIQSIFDQSKLEESIVKKTLMGFEITGKKG